MGDLLSQEEIDALLGTSADDVDDAVLEDEQPTDMPSITFEQMDALGEIGNISMGTSATTLHALLGQKVMITTPKVSIVRWQDIATGHDKPCICIRVNYVVGVSGSNVLLLQGQDVKIITSLMMGNDGAYDEDEGITDLDLSAIGECMNQMIGSASTSLSSVVKRPIDIDTPKATIIDLNNTTALSDLGFIDEYVVCTSFRMEIGTLIDSEIMQLLPINLALEMVDIMKDELTAALDAAPTPTPAPAPAPQPPPAPVYDAAPQPPPAYAASPPPQPQYAPTPQYAPPPVNAAPVQFTSFNPTDIMQQKENIEIIMDVPLEVTVELGRTSKRIKEILEFAPGSIIELDKLAGEPIDILVNGKFVAKGEVVVIDENFGIRITNIINAEYRI